LAPTDKIVEVLENKMKIVEQKGDRPESRCFEPFFDINALAERFFELNLTV
jgi:hypothetical protein